jgi:hypothetical protein
MLECFSKITYLDLSGKTEAGSAEEQPARDSRTEGNGAGGIAGDSSQLNLPIFFAMPNKTFSNHLHIPVVI